jgi:hypothetical protein
MLAVLQADADQVAHRIFREFQGGEIDAAGAVRKLRSHIGNVPEHVQRMLVLAERGTQVMNFADFQRALRQAEIIAAPMAFGARAGVPIIRRDEASSIINDNSGPQHPPVAKNGWNGRKKSDIGETGEIYYLMGGSTSSRVRKTNGLSNANTLAPMVEHNFQDDNRALAMAQEATRLFVAKDIRSHEFRELLAKLGIVDLPSRLDKAILEHDNSSSQTFKELSRLVRPAILDAQARRNKTSVAMKILNP